MSTTNITPPTLPPSSPYREDSLSHRLHPDEVNDIQSTIIVLPITPTAVLVIVPATNPNAVLNNVPSTNAAINNADNFLCIQL
ncbi:hypothetical protein M422DRAFT_245141 [Sphaerobolus stellatus SS14]|nr:hypothetical protein M422DRAFT_245141 [Sphaerobolus stellatus SS14]